MPDNPYLKQEATQQKVEIELNPAGDGSSSDQAGGNRPRSNYYDSEDYDSEYASQNQDDPRANQDSEIHMSLCLEAFQTLQPKTYGEMKDIFDQFYVSYHDMCSKPKDII